MTNFDSISAAGIFEKVSINLGREDEANDIQDRIDYCRH